jgi:hypothetical protein
MISFIPQAQKEVTRGRIAGTSTPNFCASEGDVSIWGDGVVDFIGNLQKWEIKRGSGLGSWVIGGGLELFRLEGFNYLNQVIYILAKHLEKTQPVFTKKAQPVLWWESLVSHTYVHYNTKAIKEV